MFGLRKHICQNFPQAPSWSSSLAAWSRALVARSAVSNRAVLRPRPHPSPALGHSYRDKYRYKTQKCKFKKYNRAVLRPCPHPTTHRFNKLKQNVLTDLPFKVENGLSKVMKCLGGKSLDLHRRQWERPTYALNSPHLPPQV